MLPCFQHHTNVQEWYAWIYRIILMTHWNMTQYRHLQFHFKNYFREYFIWLLLTINYMLSHSSCLHYVLCKWIVKIYILLYIMWWMKQMGELDIYVIKSAVSVMSHYEWINLCTFTFCRRGCSLWLDFKQVCKFMHTCMYECLYCGRLMILTLFAHAQLISSAWVAA